jgi:acid phosphatase
MQYSSLLNLRKISIFFILLFSILTINNSFAVERPFQSSSTIPNLYETHQALFHYYDSGQYEKDVQITIKQAKAQIDNLLKQETSSSKKLAAVFDIDETVLSNWPAMKNDNFFYFPDKFKTWINKAHAKPILPVKNLYDYLQQHNVTIFFITGRLEEHRQATIQNLKAAGFTGYKKLYLMPDISPKPNAAIYKTNIRRSLELNGYKIIVSVGDQYSDLCGGYAETLIKLPNPFYFIPGCSTKEICQWTKPDPFYKKDDWKEVCPVLYKGE